MLHPKVLIPDEYVLVRCHNIRVQKPLGIPPSGMYRNNFLDTQFQKFSPNSRGLPCCFRFKKISPNEKRV
jgi:hypothetical protein